MAMHAAKIINDWLNLGNSFWQTKYDDEGMRSHEKPNWQLPLCLPSTLRHLSNARHEHIFASNITPWPPSFPSKQLPFPWDSKTAKYQNKLQRNHEMISITWLRNSEAVKESYVSVEWSRGRGYRRGCRLGFGRWCTWGLRRGRLGFCRLGWRARQRCQILCRRSGRGRSGLLGAWARGARGRQRWLGRRRTEIFSQ